MSMTEDNGEMELAGGFSNCCNGRVGEQMMRAAKDDPQLRELIMPAGVRMLSAGGGADLANSSNCCNGRVGEGTSAS